MNVPMDNPSARIIEFVPRTDASEPMLSIKRRDWSVRECDHGNFKVDAHNRTVECGKCSQQMDAMHVLILIAQSEVRRRAFKETAENHDRRECEKTIKYAVIALGKRKVDPAKFSELYEKYVTGELSTSDQVKEIISRAGVAL